MILFFTDAKLLIERQTKKKHRTLLFWKHKASPKYAQKNTFEKTKSREDQRVQSRTNDDCNTIYKVLLLLKIRQPRLAGRKRKRRDDSTRV